MRLTYWQSKEEFLSPLARQSLNWRRTIFDFPKPSGTPFSKRPERDNFHLFFFFDATTSAQSERVSDLLFVAEDLQVNGYFRIDVAFFEGRVNCIGHAPLGPVEFEGGFHSQFLPRQINPGR